MRGVIERHAIVQRGQPDGRPMLFAHGFGCDQTLWRFVTPAFEGSHRVITFDYVGAGRSDRSAYDPDRYGSLDGYATDILEICDALELRDIILVAHSVSAIIAVLAEIREPDRFGDLVLVAPSPRYMDAPPDYRGGFAEDDIRGLLELMDMNATGWASFLAPIVMGAPDRPELTEDLEATFCSIDPIMARQFAKVTFLADNRADLSRVTTPSLIIQVSDDAVAPVEVGRFMHAALHRSRLTIIEATGHCPHVSDPEATVEAIERYLAERALEEAAPAR